jgi:hypothetical protein
MIVYPDFSNLIRHKQHYFLIHDATLVNSRIFSLNVISVCQADSRCTYFFIVQK